MQVRKAVQPFPDFQYHDAGCREFFYLAAGWCMHVHYPFKVDRCHGATNRTAQALNPIRSILRCISPSRTVSVGFGTGSVERTEPAVPLHMPSARGARGLRHDAITAGEAVMLHELTNLSAATQSRIDNRWHSRASIRLTQDSFHVPSTSPGTIIQGSRKTGHQYLRNLYTLLTQPLRARRHNPVSIVQPSCRSPLS